MFLCFYPNESEQWYSLQNVYVFLLIVETEY